MVEIIIRYTDKVNADPAKNALCFKSGDVISVQDVGWKWSNNELKNPEWRILKVKAHGSMSLRCLLCQGEIVLHQV